MFVKIKEKLIYTAEISDMDQPSADASLQTSALWSETG